MNYSKMYHNSKKPIEEALLCQNDSHIEVKCMSVLGNGSFYPFGLLQYENDLSNCDFFGDIW